MRDLQLDPSAGAAAIAHIVRMAPRKGVIGDDGVYADSGQAVDDDLSQGFVTPSHIHQTLTAPTTMDRDHPISSADQFQATRLVESVTGQMEGMVCLLYTSDAADE